MHELMKHESLRGACIAAVAALTFTIFSLVLGYFWATVLAVAVAALLPFERERRQNKLLKRQREAALQAVDELYDEISRSRHGAGYYRFDEAAEERFSVVRERIKAVHLELTVRVKHLDRCRSRKQVPSAGADWCQIAEIAAAFKRAVSDSAYWCHKGIWSVNPGPLADDWVNPYVIHQVCEEERQEVLERVIVPLSEYELRRKAHGGRAGGALVYSLAAFQKHE